MSKHLNGHSRPPLVRRHPALPPLRRADEMTERGRVKFYDARRGFGFIERDGEPDTFVHSSAIAKYGISDRQLEPGVPVRFIAIPDPGRSRNKVDAIAIAT